MRARLRAKEVLRVEAEAIGRLVSRVSSSFDQAVDLILACKGRVIVTGMGKAGIIGQKISATLASTGTPSYWLHPADAIHGDMGRVSKKDVTLALSKSGETEEVTRLLPILKRTGSSIIALAGRIRSTLAKHSDVTLDVSVLKEACTMNLAPTASTTAMLAMGDALAVVVAERKGFREHDFAKLHPGGQLGRRLLLRVKDIMRTGGANPVVPQSARVKTVLLAITKSRAGSASVVDGRGRLIGIFTDGDLRRHLDSSSRLIDQQVSEVMTPSPKTIRADRLAEEALQAIRDYKIDELVVVDERKKPIGLLDVQDLVKAGFI